MSEDHRVLLVGGTGRTGGRVLARLLAAGLPVTAVVRSAERLPSGVADDPNLTIAEADILTMPEHELRELAAACDTVVSCLGHNISAAGVVGPPYQLVTGAVRRLVSAVRTSGSSRPVRFVLMSSVSVNRPGRADTRRGPGERAFLGGLRAVLPPARDNQLAADFLNAEVHDDAAVEWVIVRPDTLLEGDVCGYALSDGLVDSLFAPGKTTMSNIADFMCGLVRDDETWQRWKGSMPVIVNT